MKQEHTWLQMVAALFEHEMVHVIVRDERQRDHVAYQLDYFGIGCDNVDLHIIPTNDVWARDNGPIFVVNDRSELAITDWTFNGWGERFEHELETRFRPSLARHWSLRCINRRWFWRAERSK